MRKISKATLREKIYDLILEFAPDTAPEIDEDMIFTDVGISSLDALQLIFRLEEEYDISIDTEGFHSARTVSDIVNYIDRNSH